MKRIFVEENLLAKNLDQLQQEKEALKNDINNLKNYSILLSEVWKGSASASFVSSVDSDIVQLEKFYNITDRICYDYKYAIEQYSLCKQKADEIVCSLE